MSVSPAFASLQDGCAALRVGDPRYRIAQRYFHSIGNRNWVLACENDAEHRKDGREWLRLRNLQDTKIRRHIKVISAANPYDPEWRNYFADRRAVAGSDKTARKPVIDTD
jgi:hypothetical protein